ncbi:MAG: hypothetical protein EPO21_22025 [Chloroflexota bacterium]|nr:MAG: hypothetical protein EPO21_22025 [Chloroflexota bacterium]
MQDSKFWVEFKDGSKKAELRFGLDDLEIFGASRQGDRAVFFVPDAKSSRHFTIIANPKAQRITFHETDVTLWPIMHQ